MCSYSDSAHVGRVLAGEEMGGLVLVGLVLLGEEVHGPVLAECCHENNNDVQVLLGCCQGGKGIECWHEGGGQ